MKKHTYANDRKFTHQTVPTQHPPRMDDGESGVVVVDTTRHTFLDTPENTGAAIELPVAGGVLAVPRMVVSMRLAREMRAELVVTDEIHNPGNSTLASSFEGMGPNTWIFPNDVESWTEGNNPIMSKRFTLAQYRQYMFGFAGPKYFGAMAWEKHSDPRSRLGRYNAAIVQEWGKHYNKLWITKGEEESDVIPGYVPESYSCIRMVTNEDLGLAPTLRARRVRRLYSTGISGANCEGETAYDAAREGFEVWVVVDAQASITLPDPAVPGWTMEETMIARLLDVDVHFCTLQQLIDVHSDSLSAEWMREQSALLSLNYNEVLPLLG